MEYHYVLTEPGAAGEVPDKSIQANQANVDDFCTSTFDPLTDTKIEINPGFSNTSNGDTDICNAADRNIEASDGDQRGAKTVMTTNEIKDNRVGYSGYVSNNDMMGNGDMTENNIMTNNGDMINEGGGAKKFYSSGVGSEKFDLSKVKSENTNEDDMYGTSTENEDYNLDADTEPEDNVNGDIVSHSKEKNSNILSAVLEVNQENIKPEIDPDTQVIVLNRHNKFNARPKPDPSILRHECDKCDEAFQFPYQLARHRNIKHEGKYPYYCNVCKKPFDRSSSLRDHMYVHTDSRPFECKQCDKSFKMKGNLRKHIRDMHTEMKGPKLKFQCEYCSKIFPTKERLTSHFLVHDTEKPYACNVCGKRFNRKNNLKEHVVIHSTEKNFVCPDCGMRFNRKYSLKIHARNHMAVKPYKCELCPSSFSQLHALKTHFRLHTGEKPFKCTICEKTFRQLATLQVHFKRHTGVKDFKCGICGKGFVIKRRLIEHERLHTGEKPFSCDLCPYRAATSSGLRLHKKTHMRQMERLAMQQVEGVVNEDSETTNTKKKRNITKKSRLPPLAISAKFVNKKPSKVNSTEDNDIEEDIDDNLESVDEEDMKPNINGEADTEEGTKEIPESLTSESLIEIVNDIADAEIYSTESGADIENVNVETESSIRFTDADVVTETLEFSEPQVQTSEVETKSKSVKRPSKVASKKSKGKEIEFENLTKEVLYKHLNEFIPVIDADVLAEKVDLITKELFEIHGKPASRKTNPISAKKSKKSDSEKSSKSEAVTRSIQMDTQSLHTSLRVANSDGAMFLQCSTANPSLDTGSMSTFGTQTMYDEVSRNIVAKPTSPQKTQTKTPTSNQTLIRQLLSRSAPQNKRPTIMMPSVMTAANRVGVSQNSLGMPNPISENQFTTDKPFLSSTLRNMLITRRPELGTEPTSTMATAGTSVKKEHQPSTAYSPAGSSAVLRDMLSTPPKHYLISTKNSYAALQRSIKRQNALASSHNGFQGQWYTTENNGGDSDFPWVEEKESTESSSKIESSVSNIKVEPMSP